MIWIKPEERQWQPAPRTGRCLDTHGSEPAIRINPRRARARIAIARRRGGVFRRCGRTDQRSDPDRLRPPSGGVERDGRPARRDAVPGATAPASRHPAGRAMAATQADRGAVQPDRADHAGGDGGSRLFQRDDRIADLPGGADATLWTGRDRRMRVERVDTRSRPRRPVGRGLCAADRLADRDQPGPWAGRRAGARPDVGRIAGARPGVRRDVRDRLYHRADQRADRRDDAGAADASSHWPGRAARLAGPAAG